MRATHNQAQGRAAIHRNPQNEAAKDRIQTRPWLPFHLLGSDTSQNLASSLSRFCCLQGTIIRRRRGREGTGKEGGGAKGTQASFNVLHRHRELQGGRRGGAVAHGPSLRNNGAAVQGGALGSGGRSQEAAKRDESGAHGDPTVGVAQRAMGGKRASGRIRLEMLDGATSLDSGLTSWRPASSQFSSPRSGSPPHSSSTS